MANMNRTFDVTIKRAGIGVKRDGLMFDATSGGALKVKEYVDEGALSITAQSAVTIYLPTLDPAFAGSGNTWMAPTAMVEPPGYARQGWDNRAAYNGFGPAQIYDADLAASFPLTITPIPGQPQVVALYRGRDAIQVGGSYSGTAAIVFVFVCYEEPADTAITPEPVFCPDGKRLLTTADIDYDAITPVSFPVGAVEPDWSGILGYHRRSYIHTGEYVFAGKANCNPEYTQLTYPAYQAEMTNAVLIGAVSDSAHRQTLINRIVRDGLYVDASIKFHKQLVWTSGAGFGHGGAPIRWMAGLFLGDAEMMSQPDTTYNPYTQDYTHAFSEADPYYLSSPSAEYPTPRWIFGIPHDNPPWDENNLPRYNSTTRDPAGEREPHWRVSSAGEAQGGSSNTIILATDEAGMVGEWNDRMIWIYNGTNGGLGEGALVTNQTYWVDGTKTATLDRAWSVPPTAGTPYEICPSASNYQPIVVSAQMGAAIAMALTGEADDYDCPQMAFWGFMKRHLNEGTRLQKPAPRWIFDVSSIAEARYTYGDVHSGNWAQKFAPAAEALFPIPSTAAVLERPMTREGEIVAAVLTSATTASVTVTTRQASGTVYWVRTRSRAKPSVAQIEAGLDHTGSGAPSGSVPVLAAGAQTFAVGVDGSDSFIHVVYKVGSEYSGRERSRALNGSQWGLSFSEDFSTDTSADWAPFKQDGDAIITYDAGNQRLTVEQQTAWRGAWLTVPFQFEQGLDYTITLNVTNATAGSTVDFQLGTFMDRDGTGADTSILEASAPLGNGQTANLTHTFTAHGDKFFAAVKVRSGVAGDTFHINSVSVTQV